MTPRLIQVTLGAGATQISATVAPFTEMIVSNNAAAACKVGDSTVTSTHGVNVAVSSSQTFGPFSAGSTGDASQWYIAGTAGNIIDVLLF